MEVRTVDIILGVSFVGADTWLAGMRHDDLGGVMSSSLAADEPRGRPCANRY